MAAVATNDSTDEGSADGAPIAPAKVPLSGSTPNVRLRSVNVLGKSTPWSNSTNRALQALPSQADTQHFGAISDLAVYSDSSEKKLGNCGASSSRPGYNPIDAKLYSEDASCVERGGECAVAYTDLGESIRYILDREPDYSVNDGHNFVDVTIRASSRRKSNSLLEKLDGAVRYFDPPGRSVDNFEDMYGATYPCTGKRSTSSLSSLRMAASMYAHLACHRMPCPVAFAHVVARGIQLG